MLFIAKSTLFLINKQDRKTILQLSICKKMLVLLRAYFFYSQWLFYIKELNPKIFKLRNFLKYLKMIGLQ